MMIGLTGYKGSGKDTAAFIFEKFGFAHEKFAAPFKIGLRALFEFQGVDKNHIHELIEGSLKETSTKYLNGSSTRNWNKLIGTEFGRNMIHQDIWTDMVMRRCKALDYENVIISDVRFVNEFDAIKRQGGIVIRVDNERIEPDLSHASEKEIAKLPVDYVFENNGSREIYELLVHQWILDNVATPKLMDGANTGT